MPHKNNSIFDTRNVISHEKLEQLVKLQLGAIWNDPSIISKIRPILIHGSPGIGKSALVKSICKDLGIEFIDCRLSEMEPCDVRGLPVPNKEDRVMEWFVNGIWPRNKNGKGIIFLDELTSCDRSIQVAAYELVLDRRLGDLYSVPPGYLIVAAGNNADDRAVATTMSSALANRFMHVELQSNFENWIVWARQNDVHPSVIGFLQFKPAGLFNMEDENLERGWPSPRSWEGVSQMCHCCKDEDILTTAVYGLVGNSWGAEFMAFYKLNSSFDDVLSMMVDENAKIEIPKEADRKYALCSTMVYLLWRGKNKEEEKKRLDGFMKICLKLTEDFASMAIMAAIQGNDKKNSKYYCDALLENALFREWTKKHTAAIRKYMKK